MMKSITLTYVILAVVLITTPAAFAVPTDVYPQDLPFQDTLIVPNRVDELGVGFPYDERIDASSSYTNLTACYGAPGDNPGILNTLVRITNRTNRSWDQLWYVADGGYPFR